MTGQFEMKDTAYFGGAGGSISSPWWVETIAVISGFN